MLSLKNISENPGMVIDRLKVKNFDAATTVNLLTELDAERRQLQSHLDASQSEFNKLSRQIGNLYQQGKKEEAEEARDHSAKLKDEIRGLSPRLTGIEARIRELLLQLPNIPHETVPPGKSPGDNLLVRSGGEMPRLEADALPHWDLAKKYDLIDFELGSKITGAGFPVYKGKAAKLQRSLINFFLDSAVSEGYTEIIPPIAVNEASAFGTGQLPDKEGQMYYINEDNLFLIPTAEVPLTNIYRDEILSARDLPRRLTAYTPCFRREAGSYGKDVRGLNRLHQFDKVEIVEVQHPDRSYETLEKMVTYVEGLVKMLGLPYRIILLCGGDMSFHAAKTYDFEVFSAAQNKWLEVSSVSNFESFQAHRMMLRFRDEDGKTIRPAHTLNGSALALPRIMAALLENNQAAEGILIPPALVPFTGFEVIPT
jgi:seryl-tRNA synthetase